LTAATVAVITLGQAAHADLLINIDKSAQRMTVTVNGEQLYDWPVSSGGSGYDTPSGTFKPFRMEIDHHSDEWDNAPMPYSIFFTKIGHAIHGHLCAAQSCPTSSQSYGIGFSVAGSNGGTAVASHHVLVVEQHRAWFWPIRRSDERRRLSLCHS
jgi:hypothetical protein